MLQEWDSIINADKRRALFNSQRLPWRGAFIDTDDVLRSLEHTSYRDLEHWKAVADWQRSWDKVIEAAQSQSPASYVHEILTSLVRLETEGVDVLSRYSADQLTDLRALAELVGADAALCPVFIAHHP